MDQLFTQMWKGFQSLPAGRKLTILAAAVATMASIALAVVFINQPDYKVLFTNLSAEDAGQITSRLQEKKIPYQLSPGGDTVSVPGEQVSQLRLELAASGLPKGGGVGFEIFDTKNLGVTEFVQQLNLQRALQGELTRTINSLDEIQQSRVHLAMPKKSLFSEDQKKPTASVIVKLKSGRNLSEQQIQGIAHLVSSSIEGMSPRDVMIVDSSGKVLSKVTEGGEMAQLSNSQIEYKKNVEKDLTSRITSMLEKVVGEGKAVVRISADLDFRVMEKTEEKYDSEEPAIRSVQRSQEKSGSTSGSMGESSVATTARQAAAPPARPAGTNREKSDETINYEISRTVNKTVMPVGDVKKLSIAVLVDGNYAKNDKGAEEYQPRPEKELTALEDLVKKSSGFDAKRGDQVVVSNVPFKKVDLSSDLPEKSWLDKLTVFLPLVRYLVILAVVVLAALFVVKPLVRMLAERGRQTEVSIREVPAAAGELKGGDGVTLSLGAPQASRELTEADIVRHMASADSKRFAELLRNWIK